MKLNRSLCYWMFVGVPSISILTYVFLGDTWASGSLSVGVSIFIATLLMLRK